VETIAVISVVTALGWYLAPLTSHLAFGLVYLLAVIALSLRVGRWPVMLAGILSAMAWDFLIIPPHFSFAVMDFEAGLMLGTYCVVSLVAGQLTARVRTQEVKERLRERRATALFHLTRALAATSTLDEAATAFLRQADEVFNAKTAILLTNANGTLFAHSSSSFSLQEAEFNIAVWVRNHRKEAGQFDLSFPSAQGFYLPLLQGDICHGVFVLCPPAIAHTITPAQRELVRDFAIQFTLVIERERLRTAIEQANVLARSETLHRALLDSVSHEFKTPIAVLNTAIEKLNTKAEAERENMLNEIRTATKRLNRLVNNLLNQTRLESGILKPRLDWCNARDIINAACHGVNDMVSPKNPITINIPADMPLMMADAALMEQIVFNLLHNAVSHTPQNSEITVTAGIQGEQPKKTFISVGDRGLGLPLELKTNPFQKFLRAKDARAGGLGLGLSIVHGFSVVQGGNVEVGENPNGGAVFTVYLPHVTHGSVPDE
jgi:two-component system sensor histidine kinase KdpD